MKINEQLAEKERKWGNFSRLIRSADYSPQKMRFRKNSPIQTFSPKKIILRVKIIYLNIKKQVSPDSLWVAEKSCLAPDAIEKGRAHQGFLYDRFRVAKQFGQFFSFGPEKQYKFINSKCSSSSKSNFKNSSF